MNKYGTMKQCPKCGGEEFNTEYIVYQSEDLNLMDYATIEEIKSRMDAIVKEGMAVKCLNCGFTANELPLDFKEINKS